MNIKELITEGKKSLKTFSKTPSLDAEILLKTALKSSREYLFTHPDEVISKPKENKFWQLIERRKKSEPISQITNNKEFFGLDFYVNKFVLTPRPETEQLVEEVLKAAKKAKNATIIDVGTGSGCIAISCAKNTNKNIKIIATDKCKRALNVAEKNAKTHNANIEFIKSDLLNSIKSKKLSKPIIFAINLPYIFDEDLLDKEVAEYEPKKALFAGKRGMDLYIILFEQIAKYFPDFEEIVFECDPRQKNDFENLKDKYFKNKRLNFYLDLSKKIRGGIIE